MAIERLGVVLVHGAGEHERGGTVRGFGTPIVDWLRAWAAADGRTITNGRNTPAAEGIRPAHTTLQFDVAGIDGVATHEWILAEANWDKEIRTPGVRDVLPWAIAATPWLVLTQATAPVAARVRKVRSLPDHPPSLLDPRVISLAVTGVATSLLLGTAVAAITAVLLVFTPIPKLRGVAVRAQKWLTGSVGDLFVMLNRSYDADAMTATIERSTSWLREHGCTRIAILAHSQGGGIAFSALQSRPVADVGLLLTFGSGVIRLHEASIQLKRASSLVVFGAVYIAFLAFVFWLGVVHLGGCGYDLWCGVASFDFAAVWMFVVPLPVFSILLLFIGGRVPPPASPSRFRWVDVLATHDPVVNADARERLPQAVFHHYEVTNGRSRVSDHITYWKNTDEFVAIVVRELARFTGLSTSVFKGTPRSFLADARRHRVNRVRWLAFARILVVALLFAMLALSGRAVQDVGARLLETVSAAVALIPKALVPEVVTTLMASGSSSVTAAAVGTLGFAVGALTVYAVLLKVWEHWDADAIDAFFQRKRLPRWSGSGILFGSCLFGVAFGVASLTWVVQRDLVAPVTEQVGSWVASHAYVVAILAGGLGLDVIIALAAHRAKSTRSARFPDIGAATNLAPSFVAATVAVGCAFLVQPLIDELRWGSVAKSNALVALLVALMMGFVAAVFSPWMLIRATGLIAVMLAVLGCVEGYTNSGVLPV